MSTNHNAPSYELLHTENPSGLQTGWFLTGNEGTPTRQRCSIGAALQSGMVMRHHKRDHVYIQGQGTLTVPMAIELGYFDEAAAEVIAKQPGAYWPPGMLAVPLAVHVPAHRPGTLDRFQGTPLGDLIAALQTWRLMPGLAEQVKVAEALEAVLATR